MAESKYKEDGSLTLNLHAGVHLHLPFGLGEKSEWLGQDDNRLDVISDWIIKHKDLFHGKKVLDLGSNAGHFPFIFAILGAEVIAVEPNLENTALFRILLDNFPESKRITLLEEDLRDIDYKSISKIDVLSTLGLIYHLNRPWEIMKIILEETKPDLWLLESMLWQEKEEVLEAGGKAWESFRDELVFHPSDRDIEKGVRSLGYQPGRLDFGGKFHSKDGSPRGFWVCLKYV